MAFVITLKNYYFRIIIKNLTKCNILSTFALKNYGKFTDYNLEKLCPRSSALSNPVLGLERVCPRKVLGFGLGFFLSPWPRTLCPRKILLKKKLALGNTCGVPPSHLTLEDPQMTSSLQDTQKEIFIFRLFIFKMKTQLWFRNHRLTQMQFLRLLRVPRWQPERKTNYLLLRIMKNTMVAKKKNIITINGVHRSPTIPPQGHQTIGTIDRSLNAESVGIQKKTAEKKRTLNNRSQTFK